MSKISLMGTINGDGLRFSLPIVNAIASRYSRGIGLINKFFS